MGDNAYYSKDGYLVVFCEECGHIEHIKCSKRTAEEALNGSRPIQEVLPDVPADIREMFTATKWCGCCYDLNTMIFPQKALDELSETASNEADCEIRLNSNKEVRHMLKDLELSDDTGVGDFREAVDRIRAKILELADRIDDGEFYETEDES